MKITREHVMRATEFLATVFVCSIATVVAGYLFGTMIDPITHKTKLPIERRYENELARTAKILADRDPCEPASEAKQMLTFAVGTLPHEQPVWFIRYTCPNSTKSGTIIWGPTDP